MGLYDDLIAAKGGGTPLDQLNPLTPADIIRMQSFVSGLPEDYLTFLSTIGYGELGSSAYMLYSGLLTPDEVYGDTPSGLEDVVLFGDDLQGFNTGFDKKSWHVVEVDPTNMKTIVVAKNFESFIRKKLAEL